MIMIPNKWLPQVITFLGILTFIIGFNADESEKVSVIVLGAVVTVGGVIWMIIKHRNKNKNK